MKLNVKITLLFLMLIFKISAQNLVCIPDENLKIQLKKLGVITDDSLNIKRASGILELKFRNCKIKNIEGLQYFTKAWHLDIIGNLVDDLTFLPPNLTFLHCSSNFIKKIDKLPVNLKYLNCIDNKISYIGILPNTLKEFFCNDNQLKKLPILPPNLEILECYNNKIVDLGLLPNKLGYLRCNNNLLKKLPNIPKSVKCLNYANNPIDKTKLPSEFQSVECTDINQNCFSLDSIIKKILGVTFKDTTQEIIGLNVRIESSYSWGFGSKIEEIEFNKDSSKLIATKIQTTDKPGPQSNKKNDSVYSKSIRYICKIVDLKEIISDIYLKKLKFKVKIGDSIKIANFYNKKEANVPCGESMCEDCSSYSIKISIKTNQEILEISFGSNGTGPNICYGEETQHLSPIIDWFYEYKLMTILIKNHDVTKYLFNDTEAKYVMNWLEKK